jgi:hypothetical protein
MLVVILFGTLVLPLVQLILVMQWQPTMVLVTVSPAPNMILVKVTDAVSVLAPINVILVMPLEFYLKLVLPAHHQPTAGIMGSIVLIHARLVSVVVINVLVKVWLVVTVSGALALLLV